MKKYVVLLTAMLTVFYMAFAQSEILKETEGFELFTSNDGELITKPPALNKLKSIPDGGLLLIPESGADRVLAFDPQTGDLVDESFIIEDSLDFFSTPIQVLQSLDKTKLYVSDQLEDVVFEFDNDGNYLGIFAPTGGSNPSICDNIRGIDYRNGTDHILVSSGNTDAVVEFDGSGNYVGNFTAAGLVDPFDVVYWQANDQYLVNDISGGNDADRVIITDNAGIYLNDFVYGIDFPEQTSIAPGGNILVATFSSPSGIYEYQPDGTLVGYYDVISSCRGVYELPNGNLLVTSGIGVYEISKSNTLVDTKYEASGNSFRFISFVAPPGGVNVTFNVDMSFQTIPPEGVHIAGNFQGWLPGDTPMNNSGGNIYTYTHNFEAGDTLEYKFINGDEWGEDESVPLECAQNNNRYLIVPEMDTALIAVCFASCEPCGTAADVTFQVDMSEQTVSPNGIHVAGSFQGWNPGSTEMIDQGDDLYAVTVTIEQGDSIEYKFVNGNNWDGAESVPPACGVDDGQGGFNRYITVPEMDTTLLDVCFASCDTCGNIQTEVDVTFKVDMSEQMVSPDGIHVAGDFQGWDPEATELTNIGDDLYEVVVTLMSTNYHQYKFINGNTFDEAEIVPQECGIDDGLGGYNRFFTVPEMDTVFADVCFSSCDTCGIIPIEVDVTFRVDMSEETISPDGIHLAGDFQGWDPASTEMTNIGNDLYEIVVTMQSSNYHEYKFINGNTFDEAESVPQECGVDDGQGDYNRFLTVPEMDTTLMDVCFSSCDTCIGGTGANFETLNKSGIIAISPNPFTNGLKVQYFIADNADVNISILNVYGQVISETRLENLVSGRQTFNLETHTLSKGIYFCRLEIVSDIHTSTELRKIIKQ